MRKACVVGLGTMGPGIAATLARGGMDVTGYDVSADAVERARRDLQLAQGALDRIGMVQKPGGGAIAFHTDLAEAVAGADLIVESVPERLDVKTRVFGELDRLAPEGAILASNTSGIPITKLQAAVERRPGRVVGMHWSNPPFVIPMIEVIAGERTEPAIVDAMCRTIRDLGLLPVVVRKDVPGFVENRVLYAIMREALALVEDGVIDPEGLDTCVAWGIGFKLSVIGPMALLDVAGLDIYEAVASYLNADLEDRKDVSPYVTSRTAQGHLGMKTGKGIFDYTPERIQALRAERAARLIAVRKTLEGRS